MKKLIFYDKQIHALVLSDTYATQRVFAKSIPLKIGC